ncbi:glutathione S-transferase family protein [Sphingobium sp. HBC34]|uniref:Glutathione S-transferase family protein n=1 Tax=Sphingobium cyanobacteriorum TaxID=3063954 RepID=A0ABT8ZG11_9SPHN|nr:glutathione S-transferase family protein [Sphingobium sp. HBC34]MDO7833474.1 glutathione S-transferase family protein [Sphingobium sp. HBC34]
MKLYAVTHSPFAARVRLALRIKGLDYVQEAPPGGGTRSPEYLAINPIGKIPALVTESGLVIAESETIIDYLEDIRPEPSLIPADEAQRIQMRNAIRTTELYVVPATLRLFGQMDPAKRNADMVEAELAQLRKGLGLVQAFVDDAPFVAGGAISKADCIVLPTLLLCDLIEHIFKVPQIVAGFPVLDSYGAKARQQADMGAIWAETEAALSTMLG